MQVFNTKLEKICKGKLIGIYDIEGFEGKKVIPYHGVIYNLNQNNTYRLDFNNKVMFWEDGVILELPNCCK